MLQLTSDTSLPVAPQSSATFDTLLVWRSLGETPRRPLNLSVVLDRSGSMAGQPLRQAIIAASHVARALTPQDTLSIVTYDDAVETVLPPMAVRDPDSIAAILRHIGAGGLTNLSGGWLRGSEHVAARRQPEAISRVLLLTDGQANVGVTDARLLRETAAEKAEAGISTTTLGFGTSFDEDVLIGMAQAGRGNYYFIQSPDDAADVFRIELESLRNLAAQNMTVRVTPHEGVHLQPIGTPHSRQLEDGTWEIELGDVYEGEGRPLAFAVTLTPSDIPGEQVVADVTYTYQSVQNEHIFFQHGTGALVIRRGPMSEVMAAIPNADVVERVGLLRIAQAKEEAVRLADRGDYESAVSNLRAAAQMLEAQGLNEKFEIAEELAQLEYFAQMLERRLYTTTNRKEMRDQAHQSQTRQRDDLQLRGTGNGSVTELPRVAEVGEGVEIECVREGGRLRMRAVSAGYDPELNVQFPRAVRIEGAHYVIDELALSASGTFYRTIGTIRLLVRPGEEHLYQRRRQSGANLRPVRATLTLADLETTDQVCGVLVQCVRDGSKLRARVVSDGYDPNLNMRFPRAIRQDGILYVVDAVTLSSDGKCYVAQGTIKRFAQP